MSFVKQTNETTTEITMDSKSSNQDHDVRSLDEENYIEMTEKYLEDKFTILDYEDDDIVKDAFHYVKKYYKPSRTCLISYFFNRFPFFDWIRRYDFKSNFLNDLVAGLTVLKIFCI